MDSTRARHHHGANLAQYHYLEKRYGKSGRDQPFWTMAVLIVLVLSSVVVIQLSETDAGRNARAQSERTVKAEQQYRLKVACYQGEEECDKANEEIRKENCQLYGEGCPQKAK